MDVAVTDGGKTDVGAMRLSVGCGVKGTVYAADGSPCKNAEVKIQSKPTPGGGPLKVGFIGKTVRCDAQGKFSIHNLPPGDYLLSSNSGNVSNPFELMGKSTRKDVTLVDNTEQEIDLFLPN
jgi:hypothetical protein